MTADAGGLAVTTEPTRGAAARQTITRTALLPLISAPPIVFAWAFLIVLLRRPATLGVAEFWADDSFAYMVAIRDGLGSLWTPLNGPLALVERIVALGAISVPPYWAPVLSNLVAITLTALVAVFLASRLPVPRSTGAVLAAGFVLLPGSGEVLGSMSHILWILGAYLVAFAFVARPRPLDNIGVAAAAFTGTLVIFAAPLYVARALRDRAFRTPATIAVAIGVIQIAFIATSSRPTVPPELQLVPLALVTRTTHLPLVAGIGLLVLVALAARRSRAEASLPILALAVAIPFAGLMAAVEPTAWFVDVHQVGSRYFWLSTGLLAAVVLVARPSAPRAIALLAFAAIFASQFALPAHPYANWATNSACIGGPAPCVVPVAPLGPWGEAWAIRWEPR